MNRFAVPTMLVGLGFIASDIDPAGFITGWILMGVGIWLYMD